jgi:1-acyl-sn-glycerol-3-phosphate acyltransferase
MINKLLQNLEKVINTISIEVLNKLIDPEVSARIEKIKIPEGDPFGVKKDAIKAAGIFTNFMYKYWNRVEVFGVSNVPNKGSAILIGNHGGVLPIDAAHIASSLILEHEPPRLVRALVERFLPKLPHVYTFMTRVGQTVGTYENAELIIDEGELLLIFPEGAVGASKPYYKYYDLDDFNVGFMELALRKKVPVIPIGVTGSHEQALVLFDFKPLAKLLGMPTFPVSAFWPLFGPLGAIPLPSKYRIVFGKPMDFSHYPEETINDPEAVKELVEKVKNEVRNLINIGLDMRPFPGL